MVGKTLAQGLMAASGEQLRLIYVLMMKTDIFQLIAIKTKDMIKKNIDHSQQRLIQEIESLKLVDDNKLRLDLFLHMTKELKLPGSIYNTSYEIENKCSEILHKAHTIQLDDDKKYREFVSRNNHLAIDSQLVLYQMQRVFESLGGELSNLSDEQQEQFADQIENFIQSLPVDQQRQIQEKLNIDSITNSTIKKVIATQGGAVLLAVIVEIAGFAAYTTLTSIIAGVAGFLGLTLPFGAYITATSVFSVLTGPIGLLLIGGASGVMMLTQGKKVKRTLLQMGIVQLMLPVLLDESMVFNYDALINEWSKHYHKQNMLIESISNLKIDHNNVFKMIKETNDEIEAFKEQFYKLDQSFEEMIDQLSDLLIMVQEHEMTETFKMNNSKIVNLEVQIQNKRETILRNKYKLNKSILKKLGDSFSNLTLEHDIKHLNKQIESIKRQQALEIISIRPVALLKECKQAQIILNRKEVIQNQLSLLFDKKQKLKKRQSSIKSSLREQEMELMKLQNDIYGIDDIV